MLKVSSTMKLINPDRPCYMGGYGMRDQKSAGMLDDLKCVALVLEIGGEKVVFCSLDALVVRLDLVEDVTAYLNEKYGIKPENVTIGAIHTHAAPELRSARLPALGNVPKDDKYPEIYGDFLIETVKKAIDECLEKGLQPAKAEYRVVEVEGFFGNRNGKELPEDKRVAMVRFVSDSGKIIAGFVNLACHPTVLGPENMKTSSDLFGYISRKVESECGVYPVMMQGAAGDASNRNYRKGNDAAEVERTGEGIFSQISGGEYQPLELKSPQCEGFNFVCDYDIDLEYYNKLRASLEKQLETETEYDKRKIINSSLIGIGLRTKNPRVHVEFNYSVLTLGDLQLIRLPGELFARFGLALKAASNRKLPIVWGYTNDYGGYMPAAEDFGVTYESTMALLPKGGTEEVTERLIEIIKKHN